MLVVSTYDGINSRCEDDFQKAISWHLIQLAAVIITTTNTFTVNIVRLIWKLSSRFYHTFLSVTFTITAHVCLPNTMLLQVNTVGLSKNDLSLHAMRAQKAIHQTARDTIRSIVRDGKICLLCVIYLKLRLSKH